MQPFAMVLQEGNPVAWLVHAALRKAAVLTRRRILKDNSLGFLMNVADELFHGGILEEKVFAVFLLEKMTDELGAKEFRVFETWLSRISTWADHDALVHYLLGPMVLSDPKRSARVFVWAKNKSRWHRRAAAVCLIRGARVGLFEKEIVRIPTCFFATKTTWCRRLRVAVAGVDA